MSHINNKLYTVVLELNDEQTIEKLMEIYQSSIWVDGARILHVHEGDLPQLLDECNHNYSELLLG